jgi:two-component sensor histidine kinase
VGLSKAVEQIKFFIHDLRIDRFFLELIELHRVLAASYDAAGMREERDRHLHYLSRLTARRDKAHEARGRYELAVKCRAPDEEVLSTGRACIDATLEACRIALLPHWRNFEAFLVGLPNETPLRNLESDFHELKNWIASTDRRITRFTRSYDEQPPMEPVAIDSLVRRYVDTTLHSYVRSAGDGRIIIRRGRLGPGFVYADRLTFKRLLFNLVMNAVDAMKEAAEGLIRIDVDSNELTITVTVTDTGVGMSPEKVEHILHSESDMRGELHSLGFRFVRQTVESFNGKIVIDSEVGQGTRIVLIFPRFHPEQGEPGAPPDGTRATAEHRPVVLTRSGGEPHRAGAVIVDDFCRSLSPLPGCLFSITILPDGAVDHFAHKPYDPDWMMGHEDLAPMLYRAVFRGRYETDDKYGTALILKAPHSFEDYWELRDVPEAERDIAGVARVIHNEYVLIARHLAATGMDPGTRVYITNADQYFEAFGQKLAGDPCALLELSELALVEAEP